MMMAYKKKETHSVWVKHGSERCKMETCDLKLFLKGKKIPVEDVSFIYSRIAVTILNSDWRDGHRKCDEAMKTLGYDVSNVKTLNTDGRSCYSAVRYYSLV